MQVEVNGDLENAIHLFKKVVGKDGIHTEVRRREESPNRMDRKKAKMIVANRRRLVRERKKARALMERKGRPHDRDYQAREFMRTRGLDGSVS